MRTLCPRCQRSLPTENFLLGNPICLRCRNQAARRKGGCARNTGTRKDGAYYRQRCEEIARHAWKKTIKVKPAPTIEEQVLRDVRKGRRGAAVLSGHEMLDVFGDILGGEESPGIAEPSEVYDEELEQWVKRTVD